MVSALGCASTSRAKAKGRSGSGAQTAQGFPRAEELRRISAQPKPALQGSFRFGEAERWVLSGALPDDHQRRPHPAEDVLAKQLVANAGERIATAAMHCAAREAGLFLLSSGKLPAPGLQRFIAGRCGATTGIELRSLYGEGDQETSAEVVASQWEGSLAKLLGVAQGPVEVGAWFGVSGKRAGAIVAVAVPRSELREIKQEGSSFLIRGAARGQGSVRAMVNQGAFGVAACETRAADASAFELVCPVNAADEAAWIQIAMFPPGRFLGEEAASFLVRPSGAEAKEYRGAARAPSAAASGGNDALRTEVVGAVNAVRTAAGLGSVKVSLEQTQTAQEAAPYYFAGQLGVLDPRIAETVALGMRAGWQVGGALQYGLFTASIVASSSPQALVDLAVDTPFGREVLLDPRVSWIAVGLLDQASEGWGGAMFSTYAMHEPEPAGQLRKQLSDRVQKARVQAGRMPFDAIPDAEADVEPLLSLYDGDNENTDPILKQAMGAVARRTKLGVQAWLLSADTVDRLPLPAELIKAEGRRLTIAVSWVRPPDEPWGRYVALIVVEAPMTAARPKALRVAARPGEPSPGHCKRAG